MASVMQIQAASDPIASVLEGFTQRRVPFDGAFFKFNVPELGMGLLVDIMLRNRRRRRMVEARVTLFAADGAQTHSVHYPLSALRREDDGAVSFGGIWLSPSGSRGSVGPITWDLVFAASGAALDPQVTGALQPFDLRLQTVPEALVSGNVSFLQHGYTFSHEPGMVGVMFGRRLPDRWRWISANAFVQPGVAVECMLLDSRIFGLPFLRARVGYFHLRSPQKQIMLLHPLTSQVRVSGSRNDFLLTVRLRQGDPIVIHCAAPEEQYHHIGDGIYAALLGNCEIEGLGIATGTAGLAERAPSRSRERAVARKG